MKHLFLVLSALLAFTAPARAAEASPGVAAVVGDQVISEYDLNQRIGLDLATSNLPFNEANAARLRSRVLERLKVEKLALEKAEHRNVVIPRAEVDGEIGAILSRSHLTMRELQSILAHYNVAMATLRMAVAVQIADRKGAMKLAATKFTFAQPSDHQRAK